MRIVVLYSLVLYLIVPGNAEAICAVVPIEEWAGSSSRLAVALPRPVDLVVVTHTVTGACHTDQSCESIAKSIRNTHIRQGLSDIGLSFLVGGNGKIYEGSGWKIGSHTRGFDNKSISLSFIGDFRENIPSEAALEAAKDFLSCIENRHYLDSNYNLVGHRQLISTISPGDALQNLIQTWPRWSLFAQTRPH